MKKPNQQFTESIFEQISRIGKAISNPTRLQILDLLCQAPRNVDALAEAIHTSQAGMSQHLRALREANLVVADRDGAFVRYRIADETVADFYRSLRVLAGSRYAELERITREYFGEELPLEPLDRKSLLRRAKKGDITILDVRPQEEFLSGHIRGAISIPIDELEDRLGELPPDQEIVAYCRGPYCLWSGQAVEMLRENNFNATHLSDGVLDWKAFGMPISIGIQH